MNKKKRMSKSGLINRPYSLFHRNRLGQFFLIAAVVIIVVIISIVTVSNYVQKSDEIKLYDLGEELGIESQQVLDYGTYNSLDETEMKNLMENFIENYVSYVGEGKNLYFLFGNQQTVYVIGYQQLTEEDVCIRVNPITPKCGNGIVEGSEECDDGCLERLVNICEYHIDDRDGCSSKCELEEKNCQKNNITSSWEICDGDDLGGATCESLGFEGGELLCSEECIYGPRSCICGFNTENCIREEEECFPLKVAGEVGGEPGTEEFPALEGDITHVVIRIGSIDYEFELSYGENFYFVIWQEIGGEKFVIKSDGE